MSYSMKEIYKNSMLGSLAADALSKQHREITGNEFIGFPPHKTCALTHVRFRRAKLPNFAHI